MPKRKSTVKIENNKVVFSKEILEYFESLRNETSNKWIDKYFNVLSDTSNFDAPKYNIHHIKPVFTFKTNKLNTREKAEKIADKFSQNLIKLSIYNHILAHFYLWKIYNNQESKIPLNYLFKTSKIIDELTEEELKKTAKLIEEFSKENKSEIKKSLCLDPRYNKILTKTTKINIYTKITTWKSLYRWALHNKQHPILNNLTPMEFTNKYILSDEDKIKYFKDIEDYYNPNKNKEKTKLIKNTSVNLRKRYCLNPKYEPTNHNTYKICHWDALRGWANKHKDLINNISPTEYANTYLISDEELINYEKDILDLENKNLKNKKDDIRKYKSQQNNRLCLDPRFNKVIVNNNNDYKYFKITNWKSLYGWATRNPNHELIENLKPKEFANKFILSKEDKIKYADEIKEYLNRK
jgi:hypothetical protein